MNPNATFRAISGHAAGCSGCPVCRPEFRSLLAEDARRAAGPRPSTSDVYTNPPNGWALALEKQRGAAPATPTAAAQSDVYRNPPDPYAIALERRRQSR